MKPNVLIRADGGSEIGLGHLVRCMALARILETDFDITFICKDIPEKIEHELLQHEFNLLKIAHESMFFGLIQANDIVVLDGYNFNSEYQKQVKNKQAHLVSIDDLHTDVFFADLIINHAPGVNPHDYLAQPYTRFALGPEYVLLRRAFLEQAKKKRKIETISRILICFGGSDFKNLTARTLETVLSFDRFKKIIVVTGSAYSHHDSLLPLVQRDKRVSFYSGVDEGKMLDLMLASDLAIVPASGILLEAIASGLRIISGMYAENQKRLFEMYRKYGAFESAGLFDPVELKHAIEVVLFQGVVSSFSFDGESARRLLSQFLWFLLRIRDASTEDCKLLFDWVNNKEVRLNSIRREQISWEHHKAWYESSLKSDITKIFILEFNGIPVGQARYEWKDGFWVIDYSIDSNYRARGFGKAILEKTLKRFRQAPVKAVVRIENLASSRIFKDLAFEDSGIENINGEPYYVYIFRP